MESEMPQPQDLHWVVFTNMTSVTMELVVEPFAMRWPMPPNQNFYIFLKQALDHLPQILYYGNTVQVYADEAVIYQEREKIWDCNELHLPPPKFF